MFNIKFSRYLAVWLLISLTGLVLSFLGLISWKLTLSIFITPPLFLLLIAFLFGLRVVYDYIRGGGTWRGFIQSMILKFKSVMRKKPEVSPSETGKIKVELPSDWSAKN